MEDLVETALFLAILGLNWGPTVVFRWALSRNDAPRSDLAFTGRELARKLLDEAGLESVPVENLPDGSADFGDCYDPKTRTVRLSKSIADNRSIASYAVAAHEVGHALQHAHNDASMIIQHRLVDIYRFVYYGLGAGFLVIMLLLLVNGEGAVPRAFLGYMLAIFFGGSMLVRIITLPVEWNASFFYAMPMLKDGYLQHDKDLAGARELLFYAAMTYVAFAVLGVLSTIVIFMSHSSEGF